MRKIQDSSTGCQGNPDLSQHRVARCGQKRFDFELALDPFEKELDIPLV
jgi:hypothetical protein